MQLKINTYSDIVFEWIPYNQFSDIKEISSRDDFATIYSAIWKDGPLDYDHNNMKYIREVNKKVALKFLHNSQNIPNTILNEV